MNMNVHATDGLRSTSNGEHSPSSSAHPAGAATRNSFASPGSARLYSHGASEREIKNKAAEVSARNVLEAQATYDNWDEICKGFEKEIRKSGQMLESLDTKISDNEKKIAEKQEQVAILNTEIQKIQDQNDEQKQESKEWLEHLKQQESEHNGASNGKAQARVNLEFAKRCHKQIESVAAKANKVPDWKIDSPQVLKNAAIEFMTVLPGVVRVENPTFNDFLQSQTVKNLKLLWGYMKKQGYAENPSCPKAVTRTVGEKKQLVGITDLTKDIVAGFIKLALNTHNQE